MKLILLFCLGFSGCVKSTTTEDATSNQFSHEALVSRGHTIYKLNCIACHNPNPNRDGTSGPAVQGASLELLQARVLKSEYPADYKPKRESKTMPAFAHLKKEIPALLAFLNSKPK